MDAAMRGCWSEGAGSARGPAPGGVDLVGLGGEDEVVGVEAADLVGPGLDHHPAPGNMQVGMMAFALRQHADLDREAHCLAEVAERELAADAWNAVLGGHLPARCLGREPRDLLVGERRLAATAGNAR